MAIGDLRCRQQQAELGPCSSFSRFPYVLSVGLTETGSRTKEIVISFFSLAVKFIASSVKSVGVIVLIQVLKSRLELLQ